MTLVDYGPLRIMDWSPKSARYEMDGFMACEQQSQEFDTIAGDRRSDKRYHLRLDLRWKLIRRKRVLETGTGCTLDLSSGGISFEADRPLPAGLNVELSVAWPAMLHNVATMQLVISGRIVRSAGQHVAVKMTQHEFRTAGVSLEHRNVMSMAARTPGNLFTNASLAFSKSR